MKKIIIALLLFLPVIGMAQTKNVTAYNSSGALVSPPLFFSANVIGSSNVVSASNASGTVTLSLNPTLSGNFTITGTDNFTGTLKIGGTTITTNSWQQPLSGSTNALLSAAGTTLTAGSNITISNGQINGTSGGGGSLPLTSSGASTGVVIDSGSNNQIWVDGNGNIAMQENISGHQAQIGFDGSGNIYLNNTDSGNTVYTYNNMLDYGNGRAGFGKLSPNYAVDVYDISGSGYDIGNSTTENWYIDNNGYGFFNGGGYFSGSVYFDQGFEVTGDYAEFNCEGLTMNGFTFVDGNTLIYPGQYGFGLSYALGAMYFNTTDEKLMIGGVSEFETVVSYTTPSGSPTNTVTPALWLPVTVNGTNGFIPWYR